MFKPLEMVKVALQILHSDSAKVTHVIAKQGLLHLLDYQKISPSSEGISNEDAQELLSRYAALDQELKGLFANLSIGRTLYKDATIEPAKEIHAVEDAVRRIQKNLSSTSEQIAKLDAQRQEKRSQTAVYRSIADAAPELRSLRNFSYFYKAVGFIATKDIPRLEASLSSIHLMLIPLIAIERRTLIVALCSQKDHDALDRALKSSYVETVDVPDLSEKSLEEVIQRIEQEIQQLETQKDALSRELKETKKDVVQELQVLREKVSVALVILKSQMLYAKGARTYVIQGWVPKNKIEQFQHEVLLVTDGRARMDMIDADMIEEVRQGKMKIPILFNNPYLIRPFESLVFNYGTQDYREIDPTPIMAISFLLMFGMMFGDIGHGAIIFGIGYWLFSKCYQYLDFGIIAMECGVASIFFGFLYGSVFGVEHLIPALWLRPAENMDVFLKYALAFGVVMISAALILNIINSFRCQDYEGGVLGHYGIVGAFFYWTSIGLALKYAVNGHLGISTDAVIILLGLPLGIIFFREPLGHLLFQRHEHGKKLFPTGIGMFALESAIDLLDVVIHYLGSTVSFIRTAAFALAHGGLFVAIFTLADMVSEMRGGGLWYWIAIILGNVLVIALEGLVVSIQTVRLEYYEFFTKFFRGGGERFQPLKLE